MTDYKNIRGKKVKFLTTDLSGEQSEGQIFYSDTDNDFKSAVATAAWSSTGAMITATGFGTHSGPNTNSFYVGGLPVINTTQHYNGTGWSLGGNYPSARYGLASAGTQTAGLAFGGEDGSDNKTNVSAAYDGSSWTAGPNINSARGQTSGTGTQTSALLAGGRGPGGAAMVTSFEEWNGTAWANLTAISQARGQHFMSGPETATFIAGGGTGNNAGSPITNLTEEFDGSSLSSGGNLNTARAQGGSSGNSGDGLVFAGASNEKNTEQYNGTSWTETSDMTATHRGCGNGAGSISNSKGAVVAGAYPATATTEEWNITVNTVTGAAFSAGGNLNTPRRYHGGAGTQTAGLAFGGFATNPSSNNNESEEYNGSSWSEGNNLNSARRGIEGFGTQTAAVGVGGFPPPGVKTEEYNGTSWSNGTDFGTVRMNKFGTAGLEPAGLIFSGSETLNTESYDGSSWTEVNNLSTQRSNCAGLGTQTAALCFGGQVPSPAVTNLTEEWDGTNWTSGGNLGTAAYQTAGMGTQTSGLSIGGSVPGKTSQVEQYNGTAWVTHVSLTTARSSMASTINAPSALGLVAGGDTGSPTNATEELVGESTSLNLKTLTDS